VGRDPVLEYGEDKVLHVVDPFFAFRLRWGPQVLLITHGEAAAEPRS
jgi:hypothetical protein